MTNLISQLKEVTMAIPSFFGRGDDPFGSLFREVQKTFENFSQRTPFARFNSDALSPKVDIAESKDAIDVTAELPGVDEKDLDVTLANGMVTVRGEKRTERDEQDKDKNWHVVEKSDLVVMPSGRQIFPFFCPPHHHRAQNSGCGYTAWSFYTA